MLVGHNTLRLMAMGMADRAPTTDELQAMIDLLDDGLRAGALGFSTGLFTTPGSYAGPEEIVALCRVAKRHNGGYFTHLRDESNKVLDALKRPSTSPRLASFMSRSCISNAPASTTGAKRQKRWR